MIQLKNLEQPPKMVMFTDLAVNLEYALKSRILSMTNYSGYPQASNVTGRLQKQFDFSNIKSMLHSTIKNRNLVKFAGDVLALVPIANMQKYQMSRADVGAFVTNHAAAHGMHALTTEEKDFISYLMTSSESMASNWILEYSDAPDANLHLKFANLYTELLSLLDTTRVEAVWTYDAGQDVLATLLSTPKGLLISTDFDARKKANKDKTVDDSELRYMINIEILSLMRIVDHYHSLFMSIDPWHIFLSPRTNENTGLNTQRASSLVLMAGYLHSLLIYP